jgi:hypothetical protein
VLFSSFNWRFNNGAHLVCIRPFQRE